MRRLDGVVVLQQSWSFASSKRSVEFRIGIRTDRSSFWMGENLFLRFDPYPCDIVRQLLFRSNSRLCCGFSGWQHLWRRGNRTPRWICRLSHWCAESKLVIVAGISFGSYRHACGSSARTHREGVHTVARAGGISHKKRAADLEGNATRRPNARHSGPDCRWEPIV